MLSMSPMWLSTRVFMGSGFITMLYFLFFLSKSLIQVMAAIVDGNPIVVIASKAT